jgi:hypothetical protein
LAPEKVLIKNEPWAKLHDVVFIADDVWHRVRAITSGAAAVRAPKVHVVPRRP